MFYWITVAGKNILKWPNSFLTCGRSYKTYRFYSLLCIIGPSPGNCFFFQQVLHQPQPSLCVSQELPAGTQMLASLSQALPALLAQLIFLVACVSTLPCFLLQLLARRKEEDFFVSIPLEWQGRVMESPSCGTRSPGVQVDLMAPLFHTVLPALAFPSSRGHQLYIRVT